MTGKDRTTEFRSIAESVAKRNPVTRPPVNKKAIIRNQISINKLASEIGREIAQTSEKMKELAKLAKTRTPFGDPARKIDEFTCDVKEDISKLQQKIENLEKFIQNQQTPNKSAAEHSKTILTSLNSTLMHTTKQFADTLEQRTQNLRSQQERRQKVTGSRHSTVQTPVFQPEFGMFDEKGEFNDSEVVIPVPLMQSYEDTLILQRVDDVKEIEEQMKKFTQFFKN